MNWSKHIAFRRDFEINPFVRNTPQQVLLVTYCLDEFTAGSNRQPIFNIIVGLFDATFRNHPLSSFLRLPKSSRSLCELRASRAITKLPARPFQLPRTHPSIDSRERSFLIILKLERLMWLKIMPILLLLVFRLLSTPSPETGTLNTLANVTFSAENLNFEIFPQLYIPFADTFLKIIRITDSLLFSE